MQQTGTFISLGPDRVLDLIENEMNIRLNNLFQPINSYINRVFEVESIDQERFIVKFYRPGRWSKEAILDEHRFLCDLAEKELPVIAPLTFKSGKTLANSRGLFFALFPKCGGRSVDEFSDEQWLQLGRLLGRVHQIGEMRVAENRITMAPLESTKTQIEYLLQSASIPEDLKSSFKDAALKIVSDIDPMFDVTRNIRIHGDCHFSNVIYRPGESLFLIDFDDMAMGPPIQDIWMLLPGAGDLEEAFVELDLLLEGYEMFRHFDRRTVKLIEPLRAMRFIHYMAWCAHQVADDGQTRAIDGFGTREYWQREIADLIDQRDRIADAQGAAGNIV